MTDRIIYSKSGFTLIEITIALLVLAIGLVGILALFPVSFDASGRAANITGATFLAQELIEDLKREGYGGNTVNAAVVTATPPPQPASVTGSFSDLTPSYPYDYDIWAYDVADTLREVIVRVYWPHREDSDRTKQRHVELSTYLAQYEP